jgi:hypothetical protein
MYQDMPSLYVVKAERAMMCEQSDSEPVVQLFCQQARYLTQRDQRRNYGYSLELTLVDIL